MDTNDNSITQAGNDARANLHGAIDKAADKTQPLVDGLAASAHEGINKMSDTLNEVSRPLAESSKQVGVAYKRLTETGCEYVRNRPGVSLLVAATVGFGLSKLLGSRK